jgi:GT2 family glycosyltransferase
VDYQSKKARYKALGTGGAISRIETLKAAQGFDEKMVGYCEDWDLEIRARDAGWELAITDAKYHDYERRGLSWKRLWFRYWRRGYYTHYFLHKNGSLIKHHRMFPPAAFIAGLLSAQKLYKITHRKTIFLLPIQHVFKMTAWYIGYFRSHLNSYEPTREPLSPETLSIANQIRLCQRRV